MSRNKTTPLSWKRFPSEFYPNNNTSKTKTESNSLNELAIASNKMLSSKYFWITAALATAGAGAYYFSKQPAGERTMNKASAAAKNTYDSVTGFFAQLINCPKTNNVGTQTTPETQTSNLTSEAIHTL